MSDSESLDSDSGIRFKTTSTRDKEFRNISSSYTSSSGSSRSKMHVEDKVVHDKKHHHRRRSRSKDRHRHRSKEQKKSKSKKRHKSEESLNNKKSAHKHKKKTRYSSPCKSSSPQPLLSNDKTKSFQFDSSSKAKQSQYVEESRRDDEYEHVNISNKTSGPKDTEDCFGPALPPNLIKPLVVDNYEDPNLKSISADICGPEFPHHITKKTETIIGPVIPMHVQNNSENENDFKKLVQHITKEVQLDTSTEEEEDIYIGPRMPGSTMTKTELELEKRALELKLSKFDDDNYSDNKPKIREEWMLELPEVNSLRTLGPTARQFKMKEGPNFSDRSSWTDTPQDKKKKLEKPQTTEDMKELIKHKAQKVQEQVRDLEQEDMVNKHKKKDKRDQSLLDLHRKKLKEEMEKEGKTDKTERRPFNREVDLKINRFDKNQTNSIIDKAKLLDSRFSSGKAKYL